jgi:hypothetical protein
MLPTDQLIAMALIVLADAAGVRPSDAPDSRSARDAFVGLLDARGVAFIQGSGPALYLESGGGRWLCVTRGATGPRCHAWPTGAPRLATIGNGYADDQTLFYATTADAVLELRVDPATDSVSVFKITCKSDDRPLDFTVPPSRRPKRRLLRCNRDLRGAKLAAADVELPRSVATAFAALPDQSEGNGAGVTSVEHQGYSIVSVGGEMDSGWDQERWTCVRSPGGQRACDETQYTTFHAIQPEATLPAAWLLMVESSAGRGGDVALVWAAARDGKLATAALDVGGIAAYGEGCDRLPGYCVDVRGAWVDWKTLSPACVQIGRTVRWAATHVRAQHRWIHERLLPPHRKASADDEEGDDDPAPLDPGTYSPGPDGWQRSGCNGKQP